MTEPSRTPYTIRNEGGIWVAHALAFDLVETGNDKEEAIRRLRLCLTAQIALAFREGLTLRKCYFAAPASYWVPPFEFMDMPTDDEIAAMREWRPPEEKND